MQEDVEERERAGMVISTTSLLLHPHHRYALPPRDASFGRGQLLTRSQLDNCPQSEKMLDRLTPHQWDFHHDIADAQLHVALKAASEEKQSEEKCDLIPVTHLKTHSEKVKEM